jgi:hypothetical protein
MIKTSNRTRAIRPDHTGKILEGPDRELSGIAFEVGDVQLVKTSPVRLFVDRRHLHSFLPSQTAQVSLLRIVTLATDDAANAMRHSAVHRALRTAPTFSQSPHAICATSLHNFSKADRRRRTSAATQAPQVHAVQSHQHGGGATLLVKQHVRRGGFDTLLSLVCSALFGASNQREARPQDG